MKLKVSLLALMMSLTLVGCANQSTTTETKKDSNQVQENIDSPKDNAKDDNEQSDDIQKEDIEAKQEAKSDKVKKEESKKNLKKQEEKKEAKSETTDFKIYTAKEEDTQSIVEFETIKIKNSASKEDKINELISALKNDYFKDDAQMVLQSIDKNGILTINLVDQQKWAKHFAGSTGGAISQAAIIETLLQRDYQGDWIKGVKVLVDGSDEEVFDHASFVDVFYR
ncbi:hypothetical protein [Romboutsia lituseburensis]|uniref:hypothetical protein n=1 Tax=Romboutsia lituseburensis TaxID=1537 RepID=UPI00215ABA40|nr:hypothetical protein [Romboutsia lituseburensis]MCR8746776.1 hypothetical protein [Romboutsia lituseburensis]